MKHVIYDGYEAMEEMVREGADYDFLFEDECLNLNKELPARIICIADLGLWNGRKSGYCMLKNNLQDIMHVGCGDIKKVYVEDGDVYMDDIHHDGTNHYRFRIVSDESKLEELTDKLYFGECEEGDIEKHTKSLAGYVCDIYGWED